MVLWATTELICQLQGSLSFLPSINNTRAKKKKKGEDNVVAESKIKT